MKKYMVIYHAPADAMKAMATATPKQKAEGMKPWMEWKTKMGNSIVDFGSPLMGGVRIKPDGKTETSKKEVTGYSIIQAENLDAAKNSLKTHPHLKWSGGCDIEVHEVVNMG